MTNPTDAGGENPTIRDVSPPSDTADFVEIPGPANSGIVCFVSRIIELQPGTRSVLGYPVGSASVGVDG